MRAGPVPGASPRRPPRAGPRCRRDVDERRAVAEHLAQDRQVGRDDGRPACERLDGRQAEALVVGGEDERVGAGVDRGELVVGDVAGERHVGQLVRPRLRRADEHERQRARRLRDRRDALARIRRLQPADPQRGSRRAGGSACAPRAISAAPRSCSAGAGASCTTVSRAASMPRCSTDLLGDDRRRHDDALGALDREVAHAKADPAAQVLAAALERHDVVQRHDLRARRAQQRAVDPRRVEDVDAPRAVRLDELVAGRGGLAQRVEQAARVAPDAARVGRRPAVERDLHRRGRSQQDRLDAVGVGVGAEALRALARGGAHLRAPAEHLEHGGGELVGAPRRHEAARLAVGDDLREAADARRDDRRARPPSPPRARSRTAPGATARRARRGGA